MTKLKREFSAGGIVWKMSGSKVTVLVIRNQSIKDPAVNYWGFPKGHIEQGESSKQAAVREVREETGVKAEIVGKIGQSNYIFTRGGEKVFKIVTMFLMKYKSGKIKKQDTEIGEAEWLDFDRASAVLSFDKDKEFLQKARQILNG